MIYNKERHKQLVRLSQDLKNQGKSLFREDQEKDSELCKYNIEVEEQVFWSYRENFVLIMQNLRDTILDFDQFETTFSLLYNKVRKEAEMFKIDLEQINKFQPSTRSYRFAIVMCSIYRQFEEIEDEYCTEQEVKDYVKEAYLKFQKFEK